MYDSSLPVFPTPLYYPWKTVFLDWSSLTFHWLLLKSSAVTGLNEVPCMPECGPLFISIGFLRQKAIRATVQEMSLPASLSLLPLTGSSCRGEQLPLLFPRQGRWPLSVLLSLLGQTLCAFHFYFALAGVAILTSQGGLWDGGRQPGWQPGLAICESTSHDEFEIQ